ncbi:MAG: redoxin domain-containing protein [Oscillospiraceae bacterium]|nr:redoxin domain-containing protein [Oscillospiraceae bacterium]
MSKLAKGDKFPNAKVETLAKGATNVADLVSPNGKTAIVFLRYYGCSLSQFDLSNYAEKFAEITAGGNSLVVGIQSTPESIRKQCPFTIPFDMICDPEAVLYKELEILPVDDMSKAGGELTMSKIQVIKETTQIQHGDFEGIEEQLPAYFVVDKDLNVLVAHYSKEMGDVPAPDDFAKLFSDGKCCCKK